MFFLDTNTCIYFLNGSYSSIMEKILATPPSEIAIPSVVKAELLFGALKSARRQENLDKVEKFLDPFEIIPFDGEAALVYANIRLDMERRGSLIGPNDLFIASIVKSRGGMLITNNEKEFGRIDGLRFGNWIE